MLAEVFVKCFRIGPSKQARVG